MERGIVGRESERAACERLLERVYDGHGATLVVHGPLGIGKSRLLADLASRAASSGFTVLRTMGVAHGAGSPLLPFRRLLTGYLAGLAPRDQSLMVAGLERALSPVIPGAFVRNATPEQDDARPGTQDWWRTIEACSEAILRISRNAPALILFDDAQRADRWSIQALRTLAASLDPSRCLLALAYRDDEGRIAETDIGDLQLIGENASAIQLGPLDWMQSRELLGAVAPGGEFPGVELTDRLYTVTGGNPLHLIHAGRAHLEGQRGTEFPGELRRTLTYRLECHGPQTAEILSAAAVIGDTFEIAQLCELLQMDQSAILPILRNAVHSTILAETAHAGILAFTHPLLHEAAAAFRLESERQRMHAALAQALSQRGGPGDFALVALHAGHAGDQALRAQAATRAGHYALGLGAMHEAALQFEEALAAARLLQQAPPEVLLCSAAEAWAAAGNTTRAAELTELLAQSAMQAGDIAQATLLSTKALRLSFSVARLETVESLLRSIGHGEHVALQAFAAAAVVHAKTGSLGLGSPDILADAERALGAATALHAPEARSVALLAYGHMVANGREFERGCELLEECAVVAHECGATRDEHAALINLVILNLKAARWDESRALATRAANAAKDGHAYRLAGQFTAKLAEIARLTGDWCEAARLARDAVLLTDRSDMQSFQVAHVTRAALAADMGDWDGVTSACAWAGSSGGPMHGYFPAAQWAHLRARACRATGDLDGALEAAEAAFTLWTATNEAYYGCEYAELYVTLLCDARRPDEAHAVLAVMERRLRWSPPPTRVVARGWIASARATLHKAQGAFPEAIVAWRETIAVWSTFDMPYRRARAELALARTHLELPHAEDRRLARKLLVAAQRTFEGLGATEARLVDPLLRREHLAPAKSASAIDQLSAREREIAGFVVRGLTNQEIADQAVLSRRTVENHLARIYAKVGVHSRTGLAALVLASNHPPAVPAALVFTSAN